MLFSLLRLDKKIDKKFESIFFNYMVELDRMMNKYQSEYYNVAFDPSNDVNDIKYLYDKGNYSYLVYLEKEIIGILGFSTNYEDIPKALFLSFIYLDKKFRNKGYSEKIIDLGVDLVKKEHSSLTNLSLSVFYNNEQAKKAYGNMGFKPISLTMNKEI